MCEKGAEIFFLSFNASSLLKGKKVIILMHISGLATLKQSVNYILG